MARQDFRYLAWRQAPFKRAYYHATSRIVLAPLLIAGLIAVGALFYYYSRYSAIIEAGLRGDIFVRSSGIYAAPLTVRAGSGARLNDLLTHLKKVGYQQGQQGESGNDKRGYYLARGATIDIYPGSDTMIDGQKGFSNLRVVFNKSGEGIQSVVDLDSQQKQPQAQVEPELISSVVNQDREKRKIIEYRDLPKTLIDAITSIEDRQFFEHSGINWYGIMRALFTDIQSGELKEGGSSITQQLVKNFFLKPDKTWKRKLSEMYMSIILEQRLSKEQIMAMYCNQIYLGQRGGFSINGFGEAARSFFGKDVSQLTLTESALLAGIIQSPNRYSPFTHEEDARKRRNKVLDDMVETDKITHDQAEAAKASKLGVVAGRSGSVDAADAPYFIDYLTKQVENQYEDRGGSLRSLRIYSTIDLELQHAAYQAVSKNMVEVEKLLAKRKGGTAGLQAAMVAMNAKTGEILAMVGGRDYAQSQLNRAVDARRQPGSVFKPFVYATAIAAGGDEMNNPITTATTFIDEPKEFGNGAKTWKPSNFGDRFEMRPMTVREALVQSKNVITVEIAQSIGFSNVARMAEKAGLTKIPLVPSMALGVAEATPLQMASAYTSFANQGRRISPIAVKRVTTKDGATLFEARSETREVMSPQVAYIMTSMMQDVLDYGTGARVRQMGFTGVAAGKTGSSNDAWFAGYTPNVVCVVWVGFDDNSNIGLTGGVVAAPIWAEFMTRALRVRPELGGNFEDPGDLVVYEIDPTTGAATQSETPGARREIFLKGTGPGDGQALPDFSLPHSDSSPTTDTSDGNTPRSAPTPKSAEGAGRGSTEVGGIDPGMIPLPPDTRKDRPRPGAEPTPAPKRSFGDKLKDILGIGSSDKAKPTPTPAPTPTPGRINRPSQTNPPNQTRLEDMNKFAPKKEPTLRPITFDTVRTTTPATASVTPQPKPQPKTQPKPPPRQQVATRPRTVTDRKQGDKTAARTTSDPRAAQADKAKLAKSNDTERKSAKKGEIKPPEKSPTPKAATKVATNAPTKAAPKATPTVEIKKPPKQPEVKKTGDQIAKSSTPSPTPKPSPTAAPATPAAPPAIVTPVINHSTPKGEGTFTLEVCATTGLLPVRGVCRNTTRQRFKLGKEPTKFCSAGLH